MNKYRATKIFEAENQDDALTQLQASTPSTFQLESWNESETSNDSNDTPSLSQASQPQQS